MKLSLMQLDVSNFTDIMACYSNTGVAFHNCIDGGAGAGKTALRMLPYLAPNGTIFAFEPFSGNFRFLERLADKRIKVIKKALYSEKTMKNLFVGSTVSKAKSLQMYGSEDMEGYSSSGCLVDVPNIKKSLQLQANTQPELNYPVQCVTADDEISSSNVIDFIKLDLTGGELCALQGMKRIILEPYFLWIEFSGQTGLLEYLYDLGFIVFETAYLMRGNDPGIAAKDFAFIKHGVLSSGSPVWTGRRITPWGKDFNDEFMSCKSKYSLIQTDIVAVHSSRYQAFNKAFGISTTNISSSQNSEDPKNTPHKHTAHDNKTMTINCSAEDIELLSNTNFRHRIHISGNLYTKGKTDVERSIKAYNIPNDFYEGRRVLDIGAWSGGFTFYFERLGAKAVALDVMDPAKSGFNTLKRILCSKADHLRKAVYELDTVSDGTFDAVFFQGVFYHLKHPLLALEKINAVMKTGALLFGGGTTGDTYFNNNDCTINLAENHPSVNSFPVTFFVRDSFLGDKTNWFVPNEICVEAWLKRSGFKCDRIWTMPGGKSNSGESRSVVFFIAKKISEPEPEHPFSDTKPQST